MVKEGSSAKCHFCRKCMVNPGEVGRGEHMPGGRGETSAKSQGQGCAWHQSRVAVRMRDRVVGNETEMEAGARLCGA